MTKRAEKNSKTKGTRMREGIRQIINGDGRNR
jgi:hypothetical protein